MAKLSEIHPREAEIARDLVQGSYNTPAVSPRSPYDTVITLTKQRADDLEMKICEALVEAYRRGAADFVVAP